MVPAQTADLLGKLVVSMAGESYDPQGRASNSQFRLGVSIQLNQASPKEKRIGGSAL